MSTYKPSEVSMVVPSHVSTTISAIAPATTWPL